jgi:tetratricopeptide (TPR) repeat protein
MAQIWRFTGRLFWTFLLLLIPVSGVRAQQIGKYVPIDAGSEADHLMKKINATTDPTQKLELINQFAAGPGKGDLALVADDLYVNYYLSQKNYDKAFEYGDKLFALDPDNLNNAVNMVRAASEKSDADKLLDYGEKAGAILERYKASAAPKGVTPEAWRDQKKQTLVSNAANIQYIEAAVYDGIYRTPEPAERAQRLMRFVQSFPDSQYANVAMGVAATSYQQAQDAPKMLQVANALLGKDPNNMGMLLLLSDYYSDKDTELAKAEDYAKKAASLVETAPKPEGVSVEQWEHETMLRKGMAYSILGQVYLEKKENTEALESLQTAAPLLKSNDASYGRNQYRLGYACLNLHRISEARAAFTEAASVKNPYQALAEEKLKTLPPAPASRRRKL